MHGQIMNEFSELIGAADKIGFAIHLHHDPHLAPGMNIGTDLPLGGGPAGPFLGRGQAFFAQVLHGFVHIPLGLLQGLLAIHDPGLGFIPQGFD